MKIVTKLSLAFLAMTLALLFAIFLLYRSEERALTHQILTRLDSVASHQQARLRESIDNNLDRLRLVASRTQLRNSLRQYLIDGKREHQEEMSRILVDAQNAIPNFTRIDVLTLDGRIVASTDRKRINTLSSHYHDACFSRGKREDCILHPFLGPNKGLMLHLAGPLVEKGKLLGVIIIETDAKEVVAAIQDYAGLGESGETILAARGENGVVVSLAPTRFDKQAALRRIVPVKDDNVAVIQSLQGKKVFFENAVDYRGKPVLAATDFIRRTGWGVVVKIDRAEAFAPLHRIRNLLIGIVGGCFLVIVVVLAFLNRAISVPISRLTEAALGIARGSSVVVEVPSHDEIGILTNAFNTMTMKLITANTDLLRNNELLDRIFSTEHVLLAYLDKDFNFIRVNRAYATRGGHEPGYYVGKHYFDLNSDPANEILFRQVAETQRPYLTFAKAFVSPDKKERGTTYWDWTLQPILDIEGRTEGVFLMLKDVTAKRQAEEQLHLTQYTIDNVKDCVFWIDELARFCFVNDAACQNLGYTREELLTMGVFDVDFKFPAAKWPEHWQAVLEKKSLTIETVLRTKEGQEYPVEVTANRIEYSGKLYHCAIARDITERKKAEKALRKLNDELEKRVAERTRELLAAGAELQDSQRALLNLVDDLNEKTAELEAMNIKLQGLDRLKSMFIASMSHELRTPLNSIIGFSSIVLDEWFGPLNEEQKAKLAVVLRTGKHLLTLINDVIDVSKLEAGRLETETEVFDIRDLVHEALELLQKDMEEKGLLLKVEVGPLTLRCDRRRLFQCLVNLLSNAVKFTERGGITVQTVVLEGRLAGGEDGLQLTVTDTGIGIAEEDQPKLFTAFSRLDSPLKERVSGTGLGLYLVKKVTEEILKGEIGLESAYGKGSSFFIKIPLVRENREEKDEDRSGG